MRSAALALTLAIAALAACTGASGDHASATPTKEDFGACASCHMADYRGAPHHVGEKATTCGVCHKPEAWHPRIVHHPWPLTGKHEKLDCFKCHDVDRTTMQGLDKACFACHAKDYERAPEHVGHFPTTCEQCHATSAWKPILANAVFPKEPEPPASAAPSASASDAPPASSAKPTTKPKYVPPPKPRPPPPPKVEPTSNASRR